MMIKRFGALVVALACVAALAACEGPEGPVGAAGAAGAQGPAGPAGPAGPPGQDANENCTQCHVGDETLIAKQAQYAISIHRTGGHIYNSGSCGSCHSHQGFLERVTTTEATGNDYGVTAPIADPVYVNCRTCHQIHMNYDASDWAFTATTPLPLYNEDFTTKVRETADYGVAAGNLCVRCHQARPLRERVGGGLDSIPQLGGPNVRISSTRYGFHYGTQGQVMAGIGAYAFTGSMTINGGPSSHGNLTSNPKLCATCHMALATRIATGGHTWNMAVHANGSTSPNVAGCNTTGCHSTITNFATVQNQVLPLLMRLDTLLVDRGIKQLYSPGYTIHTLEYYANTGTYSATLAAAMANWAMFAWDRSLGLHNPAYATSVLTNTIEAVQALP